MSLMRGDILLAGTGVDRYSMMDEIKTSKVWVDNKPIYRRVVQVPQLGASGTMITVELNWEGIDEVIRAEGFASNSSLVIPIPNGLVNPVRNYGLYVNKNGNTVTNFMVGAGVDLTSCYGYFTFEYTKADTNASGD